MAPDKTTSCDGPIAMAELLDRIGHGRLGARLDELHGILDRAADLLASVELGDLPPTARDAIATARELLTEAGPGDDFDPVSNV